MISMLLKEACSRNIFMILLTFQLKIAWQIASQWLQPRRTIWSKLCTQEIHDVDIHPDFRNLMEHNTFPSTWWTGPSVSTCSSTVNSPIASKARWYSKHPLEEIGQVQGNLTQEIAITRQRRVLKDGKTMHFWTWVQGILSRQEPAYPGNSGDSGTQSNDEDWP